MGEEGRGPVYCLFKCFPPIGPKTRWEGGGGDEGKEKELHTMDNGEKVHKSGEKEKEEEALSSLQGPRRNWRENECRMSRDI